MPTITNIVPTTMLSHFLDGLYLAVNFSHFLYTESEYPSHHKDRKSGGYREQHREKPSDGCRYRHRYEHTDVEDSA